MLVCFWWFWFCLSMRLVYFWMLVCFGGLAFGQDAGLTDEKVEVSGKTSDEKIVERLGEVYGALDGLEEVSVKAVSGVVILTGEVEETKLVDVAVGLAQKTEGVVYVRNDLTVDTEISGRLNPVTKKIREWWAVFLNKMPLFVLAIIVVVIGWLVGKWVGSWTGFLRKVGLSGMPAMLVGRLVRLAITVMGIALALELLDATTLVGAVLGVAGVAGIALGFAFQGIVENYLAGMLLSARNPFELGDTVEVGSRKGVVVRLTARDLVLMTAEGNHLRVPNASVLKDDIVNFSRNPKRRFDFAVGVSVELDLVRVRELGLGILGKIKGVLDDPAPSVVIEELGDSSVKMRFYGWMDQRVSDFVKVRSESIRFIKTRFDEEGIEMPEPIYRVIMKEAGGGQVVSVDKMQDSEFGDVDTAKDTDLDDVVREEIKSSEEKNLLSE